MDKHFNNDNNNKNNSVMTKDKERGKKPCILIQAFDSSLI